MSFVALDLRNDACAHHSRRWEVTTQYGTTEYAWYKVVTPDDAPRDVACKVQHARDIWLANLELQAAQRKLRKLTD
jgi:hypothetical protein